MALPAMASVASAAAFGYNRENFHEDRDMRLKKELAQMKFKITQAELWRQDIHDIVGLVVTKAKTYLIVDVLLLSFTVMLWCEGKFPVGVPDWLCIGFQVSTGTAAAFFLIAVWLATHAAVTASSFKTRLLTQFVRLPIPTSEEIQACRTYGSDYEKLRPGQMFRVPFLKPQTDVVNKGVAAKGRRHSGTLSESGAPKSGHQASGAASSLLLSNHAATAKQPVAVDPWGLEKSGSLEAEKGLASSYLQDAAECRHIQLLRQASHWWSTYDAFARMSLSLGATQLMTALSYFLLGHCLMKDGVPWAAFAGNIAFIMLAEVIATLDMVLTKSQARLIHIVLVLGPTASCVASQLWCDGTEVGREIAEVLLTFAFCCHGAYVWLLTIFCSVQEHDGATMPSAFRPVLYTDVFGWITKAKRAGKYLISTPSWSFWSNNGNNKPDDSPGLSPVSTSDSSQQAEPSSPTSPFKRFMSRGRKKDNKKKKPAYYVRDYASSEEEGQLTSRNEILFGSESGQPLSSVISDKYSTHVPMSPEDARPPGVMAYQDMRNVPGAPGLWEHKSPQNNDEPDFYDAKSFVSKELTDDNEWKDKIVTGHDSEDPGRTPYQIFRFATIIISCIWLHAAVYAMLCAIPATDRMLPWMSKNFGLPTQRIHIHTGHWTDHAHHIKFNNFVEPNRQDYGYVDANRAWQDVRKELGSIKARKPTILPAVSFTGDFLVDQPLTLSRVAVTWPYPHILPKGFACDSTGRHFAMTDGLTMYGSELLEGPAGYESDIPEREMPESWRLRGKHSAYEPSSNLASLEFEDVAHCPALQGKAMQDAAVVCAGNQEDCDLLVLHQRGHRLATCRLSRTKTASYADSAQVTNVSSAWLKRPSISKSDKREGREIVSWIAMDPTCTTGTSEAMSQGCTFAGTTHGRIAQLGAHPNRSELVPLDTLARHEQAMAGAVRAFNTRYLGMLQVQHQRINVIDAQYEGKLVGSFDLPTKSVNNFCIGGGNIFMMTEGPRPQLYRMPLPQGLRIPKIQPSSEVSAMVETDSDLAVQFTQESVVV